jgi:DNA-binding LacI/PurR family transcriptional regulator
VDDPKIAVLAARRIAVVTVGRLIGDVIPGGRRLEVVNDDRAATRSALDHLLLCGAGSIGLLAWPPDDSFSRDSLEGYTSWCEEHSTPSVVETVRVGSWTARGEMRAAAARLLERPDSVDAVYCMFDVMAVELLDLARLRGLRVPEDLMIATVNDAGLGDRTEPPLTTVEANAVELGERATELLLDAIADPSIPSTTHVVPTQLIPRASTSRS